MFASVLDGGKTVAEAFAVSGLERGESFPTSGFYVYALIDPRDDRVFYVGKGKGDRFGQHEREYRSGVVRNRAKYSRIDDILSSGKRIIAVCLASVSLESEAYLIERRMIREIGFRSLTNIQPGTLTDAERAIGEAKAMLRGMETFCSWISHKPASVSEFMYWEIVSNLQELIAACTLRISAV
jgi:hypothetical protein